MRKLYTIPNYEPLKIDVEGHVYDPCVQAFLQQFGGNGHQTVVFNGMQVPVERMLALTFIGVEHFDIWFRDENPSNVRLSNIYFFPQNIEFRKDCLVIDDVEFKHIPGFSKYYISKDGTTFNLERNVFMHKTYNHAGYQTVTLTDDGGFRSPRKVHRLVYCTYVGEIAPDYVVDHIDDVRYHNNVENLQQLTYAENVRKTFETGANSEFDRWNIDDIRKICEGLERNMSIQDLAKLVNFDYFSARKDFNHLIHRLLSKTAYADITCDYDIFNYDHTINKKDKVLDPQKVLKIREMLNDGYMVAEIARQFGCTTSTITKIRDGKTWKNTTDVTWNRGSTTIESIT